MKNPLGLTGTMMMLVGIVCYVLWKTSSDPQKVSDAIRYAAMLFPVGAALFFLSVAMKKIKAGKDSDESIADVIQKFEDEQPDEQSKD